MGQFRQVNICRVLVGSKRFLITGRPNKNFFVFRSYETNQISYGGSGGMFQYKQFQDCAKKGPPERFQLIRSRKGSKGRELGLNCRAISRLCKTPRNKGNTPLLSLCDKFGVPKLIFAEENTVFGRTLAVSLFLVAKNKGTHHFYLCTINSVYRSRFSRQKIRLSVQPQLPALFSVS